MYTLVHTAYALVKMTIILVAQVWCRLRARDEKAALRPMEGRFVMEEGLMDTQVFRCRDKALVKQKDVLQLSTLLEMRYTTSLLF